MKQITNEMIEKVIDTDILFEIGNGYFIEYAPYSDTEWDNDCNPIKVEKDGVALCKWEKDNENYEVLDFFKVEDFANLAEMAENMLSYIN